MATKVKTTSIRVPAKEAKNRFGELLEAAQRSSLPIIITKNNRPVAQLMRFSEKTRFEEMEDKIWLERALRAERTGGYIGVKASAAFLKKIRDAADRA